LKLKELGDAVVDIATPHDGFHYAAEVVISQNDVRCFLRNIRTSNALHRKHTHTCGCKVMQAKDDTGEKGDASERRCK